MAIFSHGPTIMKSDGVNGDYVLISSGEMDFLSKCILDYKTIETGGQLFGHWTFDGAPVVQYVLGPGPNAGHHNAFFMQDLDYLKSCAKLLKQKYGLDHIGEWHSHHQLGLAHPSGHDARNLNTNIRRLGYSKFLLCIGTCTSTSSSINAFLFTNKTETYCHVPWMIKIMDSPYRKLIEADDESNFFCSPKTTDAKMTDLYVKGDRLKSNKIIFNKNYWLQDKRNRMILKSIIDFLTSCTSTLRCTATIDANQEVHLELYQDSILINEIYFPKDFPIEPPVIKDAFGKSLRNASNWNYKGDIFHSFQLYYLLKN